MGNAGRVQSDNESVDGAIAAVADAQFGVFSRQQALDAGFTPRQIQLRVSGDRWASRFRAVYRIVGAPETLQQAAMAAALYAGDGALVSHSTAGLLWGIQRVRAKSVELWVPSSKQSRSQRITIHRGTRLDRADRTKLGPIPVTTVARTLIDLSARMEDARLLAAVEDALHRKLVTAERLTARVDALRRSGRPGAGRLAELLAGRGQAPALESALEAKVWLLIRRSGLPLPKRQHWVVLPGGRFRLDFAWPEHRVGLECDGWEHHGTRSAFEPDRARLAEFAAARWRVLPVTWNACTREPERVDRWLRAALASAPDSLVTGRRWA
jgi:very-short-patch-repair endonuclease